MALTRSTDPLVWIDCEMTGLDPSRDTILSISCILTNSNLLPLDSQGFNAVIHHTEAQLSTMSDWCIKTHGSSGLTQECLSSTTTAETASQQLLAYIEHFIPEPRRALLAGNSVHADKSFLMVPPWNQILEHLHYRLFDVSSMKEMVRRWGNDQILLAAPRKELRHTAREDVLESIQEAKYYKGLIEGMLPMPGGVRQQSNVSVGSSTTLNSSFNSVGNNAMPGFEAGGGAGQQQQPTMPMPGTKQGQEMFDMMRNNGTMAGDVGSLDPGFRTDVT